jgi:hypothetical protein
LEIDRDQVEARHGRAKEEVVDTVGAEEVAMETGAGRIAGSTYCPKAPKSL